MNVVRGGERRSGVDTKSYWTDMTTLTDNVHALGGLERVHGATST